MEEKTKQEFNEVSNLTAICRSTDAFARTILQSLSG